MDRPTLTYRPANRHDIPQIAELHYHSFPTPENTIPSRRQGLFENPIFKIENRLVGEHDGRLLTSLNQIYFKTWIGGAVHPMLGVASVTVAPEARRLGYASEIMVEAMRRARNQGVSISTLYPFRYDFYASLGYALACELRAWEFRPEDLPVYPERARARRGGPADETAIAACYERVARASTLMIERSTGHWQHRTLDDGQCFTVVFEDDEGTVRGYFLYEYARAEDGRMTRLEIYEIVYETEEALRGLLGYIAALRDQILEARCVTRCDERLDLRLRNPRWRGAIKGSIAEMDGPHVRYGAMARVLDVERALGSGRTFNGASGSVRLDISDERLPENSGAVLLVLEDGRATTVAAAGADASAPTARMAIGAFSQIYTGYATTTELQRVGLVDASDEAAEVLDRAFACEPPSLLDVF